MTFKIIICSKYMDFIIFNLIKNQQTETTEDDAARKTQTEWTKINIESSLHCPHQLPQKDEQPDSLPTLLGVKKLEVSKVNGILKPSATIAVFSAFGQKVLSWNKFDYFY